MVMRAQDECNHLMERADCVLCNGTAKAKEQAKLTRMPKSPKHNLDSHIGTKIESIPRSIVGL